MDAPEQPVELPMVDPEAMTPELAGPDRAEPAPAAGRSRRRWLIGGAVAVAAVAGGIWAVGLLGARPLPEALRYLPGDSVVVAEIRPDLPGDQRARLGAFLAHFPGFADQSNLSAKLDEALGRLVAKATSGRFDFATQVKPLLAGPLVLAFDGKRLLADAGTGPRPGVLLVFTTDGKATCDLVFKTTAVLETHRAVDLRSIDGGATACALDGRFLLLGDAASVRAGIDAHLDRTGIDASSRYRAARSVFTDDQLATLYADGSRLADLITAKAGSSGVTLNATGLPAWVMAGIRITDDALAFDVRVPSVAGPLPSGNVPSLAPAAPSRFAATLPADTLGYLEAHGVSAAVKRILAVVAADPGRAAALAQLQGALAVVGGLDNLVGWIDELGLAVIPTDGGAGGALMLRGGADAASGRLTQIRNLLVLASTGTDITLKDSTHNGTTITTVDLGDLGKLGSTLGVPGLATTGLRLQFSLAARDGVLFVAYGQGALEKLLDVVPGSGLGGGSAYQRAVTLAGSPNNAQAYLALAGIIAWASSHLPATDVPGWSNLKPYLDHLAALAVSATGTASGGGLRVILTVK